MLPITEHKIEIIEDEWYDVSDNINQTFDIQYKIEREFSLLYCVAYRDPALQEWIVARWIWNDEWLWLPDWVWHD